MGEPVVSVGKIICIIGVLILVLAGVQAAFSLQPDHRGCAERGGERVCVEHYDNTDNLSESYGLIQIGLLTLLGGVVTMAIGEFVNQGGSEVDSSGVEFFERSGPIQSDPDPDGQLDKRGILIFYLIMGGLSLLFILLVL